MHDSTGEYDRAEKARIRKQRARFRSARHALSWYFETAECMQAPSVGSMDVVHVDGGTGGAAGAIDDMLVTVSTIGSALDSLKRHDSKWAYVITASIRDGASQGDLAKKFKSTQPTVSGWIGKGEAFIAGVLVAAELL